MSNNDLLKTIKWFHFQIIIEGSEKLVFFPSGYKLDENGEKKHCGFLTVPPYEEIVTLSPPFEHDSLVRAMNAVLLQTDKYERWYYDKAKRPWEAIYYKTRSFRAAMKGKQEIDVRSVFYNNGDEPQIEVDFFWPCRGSYQLYGLSSNKVNRKDGIDGVAKKVKEILETDFTKTEKFKISKHFLLLP